MRYDDDLDKFVGKKMFINDQQQFKKMFNTLFLSVNFGRMGIHTINGYFKDFQLDYVLLEINDAFEGRYWLLGKITYSA